MRYERMMGLDVIAMGEYLGIPDNEWFQNEWIPKRECPNCVTYDHSYQRDGEGVVMTSAICQKEGRRCPGCTHKRACGKYNKGVFITKFVAGSGGDRVIRRFLYVQDLAARIGVSAPTIRRWIRIGKM